MQRTSSLVLACLAAFLVAMPLVLEKPGWPAGLKSDEPAYYLMALSLAHDGDLEAELHDIERLFEEFPFHVVHNLILATDDGWHTVYFGKPYIYSFFAAPWARLFGGSGMVAFNMAMMVLMIWLGSRYLGRFNPPGMALLFSSGFFLLSCGFSYIFWIHPEIFNMAAVTVCLYFALADPTTSPSYDARRQRGGWRAVIGRPELRLLLSGAALMPAVYNKPMLAAFALPALYCCWEKTTGTPIRRLMSRRAMAWVGGSLLGMGLVVGGSMAMTGHPSAYFLSRGGQKVCSADTMPIGPAVDVPSQAPDEVPATSSDEPQVAENGVPATSSDESQVAENGVPATSSDGVPATSSDEPQVAENGVPATSSDESTVATKKPPKASWYWMFRIPRPPLGEVLENIRYFFWGRHTGLFLYFPFSLLALILFGLHGRRSLQNWTLLASLMVIALFFLLWIPFNWQGGGGFVGNRYFVNAYPGFLFLVGRIAPRMIQLVGFALGGVLLGPTIFSPFGRAVPWPTLQAHVRNFPFNHFPLELSLREVPGYDHRIWAGALVRGRNDQFLPRGARFWVHGATTTELWVQSQTPLDSLAFEVSSLGIRNTIHLRLGDAEQHLVFAPREGAPDEAIPRSQRAHLTPSRPSQVRTKEGVPIYVYRVEVEASRGTVKTWDRNFPPQDCFTFAYNETIQDSFLVGAQMAYLGTGERLQRDLYAVDWLTADGPSEVTAGSTFFLETAVGNTSQAVWPSDMPTRIALSYRWKQGDDVVVENGLRSHPERDIHPGEVFSVRQEILAPTEPGQYTLELDLVYELVSWFSWQNDDDVQRLTIQVLPDPEPLDPVLPADGMPDA